MFICLFSDCLCNSATNNAYIGADAAPCDVCYKINRKDLCKIVSSAGVFKVGVSGGEIIYGYDILTCSLPRLLSCTHFHIFLCAVVTQDTQ